MRKNDVRSRQVQRSPETPTRSKRSSARARGAQYQRKIKKFLEDNGYQVFNATPKASRFFNPKTKSSGFASRQNDPFGCDLIAKRNNQFTLWIQATRHKSLKEKIKVLSQFPWTDREIVLVFINRQSGWDDIYQYDPLQEEKVTQIGWIFRKKYFGLVPKAFDLFKKEE